MTSEAALGGAGLVRNAFLEGVSIGRPTNFTLRKDTRFLKTKGKGALRSKELEVKTGCHSARRFRAGPGAHRGLATRPWPVIVRDQYTGPGLE